MNKIKIRGSGLRRALGLFSGSLVVLFLTAMSVLIVLNSIKYLYPYQIPSRFLESKCDWFALYLPALYVHTLSSALVLVAGVFQFSNALRRSLPGLHRFLGKLYIGGILFLAAPSGWIMAWFAADRGWLSAVNFLLLATLWAWFTYRGYAAIRAGNPEAHRRWLCRSYALALSAVFLRWYVGIFAYFFQWVGETPYVLAAWLSWLPNWVAVEGYWILSGKVQNLGS